MTTKQKKEAIVQATEEGEKRVEEAFKDTSKSRKGVAAEPYYIARHAEHVRLMFEVCWFAVLAGISAPLQEADITDTQSSHLILIGFRCAIHLGCIFDLETSRNAFVSTLTKYAYVSSVLDFVLKPKMPECIKALLESGAADGNWMNGSWVDILRCVSSLERVTSAHGNTSNNSGNTSGALEGVIPGVATGLNDGQNRMNQKKQTQVQQIQNSSTPDKVENQPVLTKGEIMQAESIAQNMLISMDRIFTSSSRLTGVN